MARWMAKWIDKLGKAGIIAFLGELNYSIIPFLLCAVSLPPLRYLEVFTLEVFVFGSFCFGSFCFGSFCFWKFLSVGSFCFWKFLFLEVFVLEVFDWKFLLWKFLYWNLLPVTGCDNPPGTMGAL